MYKWIFHTAKPLHFFGGLGGLLILIHVLVGFYSPWLSAESTDYSLLARILVEQGSFRLETGYFAAHHPPLFPLILAFYYGCAQLLNLPEVLVCSAGAIGFVLAAAYQAYALAKSFSSRADYGRWAALLLALQPFVLYASFSPLSEIPFVFLLLFSLRQFWVYSQRPNTKSLLMLSLGVGLSMLCRSVFILGPLFLFIGILALNKKQWKQAVLACLACLLVIAPWSVYASVEKNQTVVLSSSAMPGIRDGLSFNHKSHRQALALPQPVEQLSEAFWTDYDSMKGFGDWLNFIQNRPLDQTLATYLYKAWRCWYGTDSQRSHMEHLNGAIALIWFMALFLAFRIKKAPVFPPKHLTIACLILSLYFWGLATLALSIVRYMVPVFALMALYIPILFSRKA